MQLPSEVLILSIFIDRMALEGTGRVLQFEVT